MDKVVNDTLPQNWVPHAVIIDGMFLLYAPPPPGTTTVLEFSRILSERYIAPYFEAGALEVHLLFDDPDRHSVSPKASERRRRYAAGSTNHVHYDFTEQLPSSQKWSSVTECCVCKHKLAQSLALKLLQQTHLTQHQRFVTAGAFEGNLRDKAMFVGNGSKEPQVLHHLNNCSEEADMRIWLHCIHSVGTKH